MANQIKLDDLNGSDWSGPKRAAQAAAVAVRKLVRHSRSVGRIVLHLESSGYGLASASDIILVASQCDVIWPFFIFR